MTSKSKQVIMAAVGAYLVYTGVSLVRETIAGEPKNQILFILAGVFFAIFGLATIVHNIRIIVKATKAEIQATEAETEENSDTDAEESEETEKESVTGTIEEIKDFMFTIESDKGTYAMTFDTAPEGLSDVKEGDQVTVTYTGELSEVDAFTGTIISVEKAN